MTAASNRFRIELLGEFDKEVEGGLLELKQKMARHLLGSITGKMPVKTGRAKANTLVSIGRRDNSKDDNAFDKTGEATISKGEAVIAGDTDPFKKVFVQNNVDYILALEGGHSNQAPLGMFALAVAEAEVFFR